MIYSSPVGGFGNMLFQIAALWTLANDNNDELCLLNIDQRLQFLVDYAVPVKHAFEYKYLLDRFSQKLGQFKTINYPFVYRPMIYHNEHQYVGFFQSEKNFKHRRNEIIKLFRPTEKIIDEINKYSFLFNKIGLHVRMGADMKSQTHVYILPTMEYYNKALSYLPQDLEVVIFTDNIEWCKENFIDDRFIIIDGIDYISLYLMTKMKHHIISNSSFSWWGAWMSKDNAVIAPKDWFTVESQINDKDLIPENWIRI